jgi:hypothetical protein
MFRAVVAVLAVAALSAAPAAAFAFHLVPGTQKCFTEELGTTQRTHLTWHMSKSHAHFVSVTMTRGDGVAVLEHKRAEPEYEHVFQPQVAGDHTICFHSHEKASVSAASFDVTLTMLSEYEYNDQKAYRHDKASGIKNEKNKALMNQARYIEHNLHMVHDLYKYLKEREAMMRDTNESTNGRTLWITVFTVLFVGAVRYLHHVTLRRHLRAKKFLD